MTLPQPRDSYSVSTIWEIDDVTVDNGATEVLPGGHRWDGAPIVGDRDDGVVVEMPAGSVVVFLGTTERRGGANRSAGRRRAITPQYCASWASPRETFTVPVRPEMAASLPERVRELLGYSIHPQFMGHVDGRRPGNRLVPAFVDATAGPRSGEFWTDWAASGGRTRERSVGPRRAPCERCGTLVR